MIEVDGAEYETSENLALLSSISYSCDYFVVPRVIYSFDGSKFKIIGISNNFSLKGEINSLSFDESTEIEEISVYFIFSFQISFFLPLSVKRISDFMTRKENKPAIFISSKNRFVSVIEKRSIMNHYPFEIVSHEFHRLRLFIRETTRVICSKAFYMNEMIKSIVFPPSVELISKYSFFYCINLTHVTFKGNSKLRKIGKYAFSESKIMRLLFPPSLEKIGDSAFRFCANLRSVAFTKDAKLIKIGKNTFTGCPKLLMKI